MLKRCWNMVKQVFSKREEVVEVKDLVQQEVEQSEETQAEKERRYVTFQFNPILDGINEAMKERLMYLKYTKHSKKRERHIKRLKAYERMGEIASHCTLELKYYLDGEENE